MSAWSDLPAERPRRVAGTAVPPSGAARRRPHDERRAGTGVAGTAAPVGDVVSLRVWSDGRAAGGRPGRAAAGRRPPAWPALAAVLAPVVTALAVAAVAR